MAGPVSMLLRLQPATSLAEVHQTLFAEPLLKDEEWKAFYRDVLDAVRGGDRIGELAIGLGQSFQKGFFKSFLFGHPGVGKSTELTRLIHRVSPQFHAIRFSVNRELDTGAFKPFDVLILMMIRVIEETEKICAGSGEPHALPATLLKSVMDWFAKEISTQTRSVETEISGSAGIGPPGGSVLTKLLGLFATVKGEMKYAADRKKEVVEYRLSRISSLIDHLNGILGECNRLLIKTHGHEWLFIGEDFDKPGIQYEQTESLFLNYANIFHQLNTHLVFEIPVELVYSDRVTQLPILSDRLYCIPDIPVFRRDHTTNEPGLRAIREVLEARVNPRLFVKTRRKGQRGQMDRLIIASGGNLRDLFSLVRSAALKALRPPSAKAKIDSGAASLAIRELRTEYERRLGQGPYDKGVITYVDKRNKLLAIYEQSPEAMIPDPTLYSLLRARAIQEFSNGDRWFGVHPLVVDVLKIQKHLEPGAPGGTDLGPT